MAKIGSFWQVYSILPIQFVLTFAFDRAALYGNNTLSFLVLWTEKRKVLVLQKTCFKVKELKTCQHATSVTIIQVGVPTCQKAYQFFNYFSEEFFNLRIFQLCLTFANFKNIWAILENLPCEKKDLNLSIRKILLRKNLVSLEFLTSLSTGHVGLTGELFG